MFRVTLVLYIDNRYILIQFRFDDDLLELKGKIFDDKDSKIGFLIAQVMSTKLPIVFIFMTA